LQKEALSLRKKKKKCCVYKGGGVDGWSGGEGSIWRRLLVSLRGRERISLDAGLAVVCSGQLWRKGLMAGGLQRWWVHLLRWDDVSAGA